MWSLSQTTATLKDLLFNGLEGLDAPSVTLLAPDRITTGEEERAALNLFLYRIAPHSVLQDNKSRIKLAEGQVALEAFYLITAYGAQEYQTELLLGRAVKALANASVLVPKDVQARIQKAANKKVAQAPVSPHEMTITPYFMSMDDLNKLWSSLQAKFRPSVVYRVAPIIIS